VRQWTGIYTQTHLLAQSLEAADVSLTLFAAFSLNKPLLFIHVFHLNTKGNINCWRARAIHDKLRHGIKKKAIFMHWSEIKNAILTQQSHASKGMQIAND
jgi:hypothetical protein